MWTIVATALGAAKALLSWFGDLRRARERAEYREAGRNEQKVSNLEDDRQKASEARRIDEDVDRLSDSAVTDGLRKYARRSDK